MSGRGSIACSDTRGRKRGYDCRDKVHLRHEKPSEAKGRGGGKPKDLSKKAILLSGPPGIGKTSSAMIISRFALAPSVIAVFDTSCETRCAVDSSTLQYPLIG